MEQLLHTTPEVRRAKDDPRLGTCAGRTGLVRRSGGLVCRIETRRSNRTANVLWLRVTAIYQKTLNAQPYLAKQGIIAQVYGTKRGEI